MSANIEKKINRLLETTPKNVVLLSSWLVKQGYSRELLKRYQKSQWLRSVGYGAWTFSGGAPDYLGAVYALQTQLGLSIHPAAQTALQLQGKAHYLALSAKRAVLMGSQKEALPSWFKKGQWGIKVSYKRTSFLPPELGMQDFSSPDFRIQISTPTRAILECLYLANTEADIVAAHELLEGLNTLRPDQLQKLLECCTSIKVKRLFFYLAEHIGHEWFNYLVIEKIDLGKGKRSLVHDGVYDTKYQITVPRSLADRRDSQREG